MKLSWIFVALVGLVLKRVTAEEKKGNEKAKVKNPYFTKFQETAHLRPTKCQVCRLVVTELNEKLKKTNSPQVIHKGYDEDLGEDRTNSIDYQTSEVRLMEVLDGLCNRMKLYQARAGPDFPYIKGAKGHLREVFDDIKLKSKVKLNFELPDDVLDDYTHEITRVKFECIHLLEQVEEHIEEWYFKHQQEDLTTWLCVKRVLKEENQDCLTASDELPSDYYSAFESEGSSNYGKPKIPMAEKREEL